jgi:integrase
LIRWRRHIEPRLGSKRLNKLGPRDVLNLVADLREEGHAEWTVHGITVVLRFVLRHARHAGYVTSDPFATIPPDELPQQRVSESFNRRVLRPDEIEKLLTRTPPSLRSLVTFIAFSGVRVSEACGLQWGDVSLMEGTVAIREQLAPHKREQNPRRVKLKSRASARVVPLLPRSSQALEAQYEHSERAGRGEESDYVFATASGRPVSRHRVYGAVATAARKAGLGEGVNPQTLRRTVSTATAHAGLPAVVGASITGHSREVYDRDYVTPFRDAAEREQVRDALANIGFGSLRVDQALTSEPAP